MNIVSKVMGIITCCIGLVIWYIDYIVFSAIIAGIAEMTGPAVLGLQVIGWIVTFSTMLFIFMIGFLCIYQGIIFLMED